MFIVFTTIVLWNNSTIIVDHGGFLRSPASLNITLDAVAVFQCQHPTADGINWRINGSGLRGLPEGVITDRNDGVFFLIITALPVYNQTVIECVAFFSNSPSEETDPAIMIIQGTHQECG